MPPGALRRYPKGSQPLCPSSVPRCPDAASPEYPPAQASGEQILLPSRSGRFLSQLQFERRPAILSFQALFTVGLQLLSDGFCNPRGI